VATAALRVSLAAEGVLSLSLHIDPGVHALACAVFSSGVLWAVRSLAPDDFFSPGIITSPERLSIVCIEKPQIYKGSNEEKDPNDCVDLFGAARYAEAALVSRGAPKAEYHFPRVWKGQIKKPQHHRRIWSVLAPAERAAFARDCEYSEADIERKIEEACQRLAVTRKVTGYAWAAHNLFDAVGIGLWRLKRVGVAGHRFA
jgi:hypothetical protein